MTKFILEHRNVYRNLYSMAYVKTVKAINT